MNLRDHKRPESKNTFYNGFNVKIVFFLSSPGKIAFDLPGQNNQQVFQKITNLINCSFGINFNWIMDPVNKI